MNSAERSHFLKCIEQKSTDVNNRLPFKTYDYVNDCPTEETKYVFFESKVKTNKSVVYVHGGTWVNLNLQSSTFLADYFIENNFNFIAVGYDPYPVISIVKMISQVRQVIKKIIENHPEQNEIYLIGHSAGAHLVMASLVCDMIEEGTNFSVIEREKLAGAILVSGTYDLTKYSQVPLDPITKLTPEEAWEASPIFFVENIHNFKNNFMILIIVEGIDLEDFKFRSRNIYEKLKPYVNESCLNFITIEDVTHFTIISQLGNEDYNLSKTILNFLN